MTKMHEAIIELIKINKEADFVDFKEFFYSNEKKHDLIKDVVSFANNINVKNKYIIFGVVNSTGEIKGIEPESLLDISDIIDFLRVYVEPFVEVELDSFEYQGVTIAYLTILSSNTDRPYVIKKEYQKRSITYLRQGEIYIRKGASNFIACRADIDEIYANKGTLEVNFYEEKLEVCQLLIGNQRNLIGKVRCVLFNNSSQSIVVDSIRLVTGCDSNIIEYDIDFVDDEKTVFSKKPIMLQNIPLQLEAGSCIQKTLYFSVSELSVKKLYEKTAPHYSVNAQIFVNDVLGKKYKGDLLNISISCTHDLIKKWG